MKPSRAFVIQSVVLVAAALVLAGCSTGKGKSTEPAYKGEFKEFDLFLFPLTAGCGSGSAVCPPNAKLTGGWDLYPGANVDAWAFSPDNDKSHATVPGPEIHAREGDTVRINFYIQGVPMAHTIHWHGLHVPWDQDGVPYVSQMPIGRPDMGGNGSSLTTYEFTVHQSGTYWYHCHVDTAHHLDMGMYGAFIVDPANPAQDPPADHEYTLMLDEWDRSHSHSNSAAINNAISKSGDPRVTANDFYSFIRDYLFMNPNVGGVESNPAIQNSPGLRETRDWYPVTYAPYFGEYDSFLINGKAFPSTAPLFIKMNETIRIRLINAGEQVHSIHLHGHHFLVTHKDGYLLPNPYYADTILIGPAERYDVYVKGDNPGPWMIHDHISLNEMNDFISPGGMSTMLCYTDGWSFPTSAGFKNPCAEMQTKMNMGMKVTAGDIVTLQAATLVLHGATPTFGVGAMGGSSTTGMGDMPGMDMGTTPATTPPGSVPSSPAPSPSLTLPTVSLPVP